MRKAYQILTILGVAAASLTSCSRSDYAVNQRVLAPVSSSWPVIPEDNSSNQEAMARVVAPAAPQRSAETALAAAAVVHGAKPLSAPTAAIMKAARPTLMQRVVLNKVAKQVAKIQIISQNKAHTEHTASNVKSSLLLALAGLVIILIGGIIGGANVVVTIGGIVFVVGLVLLVIALIGG